MAEINVPTEELVQHLSHRVGELEAEKISLQLVLREAGDQLDRALRRCTLLEADLEACKTSGGDDR
jgi:hypothetical protein